MKKFSKKIAATFITPRGTNRIRFFETEAAAKEWLREMKEKYSA